tara:strand:- start:91 stop:585 length:495 start_codon:yes stop_codon:yes gene_type:complete
MVDDIHLINNILTIKSRNKLVEELQHLLVDGSTLAAIYGKSFIPGRQTHPTLHLHPNFKELTENITEKVKSVIGRDVKVVRMWGKWLNGEKDHMNWHHHLPSNYSTVYYLKVPSFMRNGTLFKEQGLVRTEENSLLIFPSKLKHSSPSYFWKGDRYVVSADLVV